MIDSSQAQSVVFIIDDDESLRSGLKRLFRSVGLHSEAFQSTHEFTQSKLPDAASCLLLDVRLPGLSGLDFQAELVKSDIRIPGLPHCSPVSAAGGAPATSPAEGVRRWSWIFSL